MKNNCSIIRDILPLYIEDMTSDDTRAFVEEHLAACADCRAEWEQMKKPAQLAADTNAAPLKNLKKKLFQKRVQTIIFSAALAFAIVLSAVSVLTAPLYFPYSENLLHITENGSGSVTIAFDDAVTGYAYLKDTDPSTGIEVYHINAWQTTWDLHFIKRGTQNMVISSEKPIAVYYAQNNGAEDVFLYGTNPNPDGGTMVLPRLILGQYVLLALIAATILGSLLFINRKHEARKMWLERVFLLPVAYVIAHLCTKGLAVKSFSTQRDFSLIVLVAILVYGALLLGMSLYQLRKEDREK